MSVPRNIIGKASSAHAAATREAALFRQSPLRALADFFHLIGCRLLNEGAEQNIVAPPFFPQESNIGGGKENHA
jgi:hypothetical protein